MILLIYLSVCSRLCNVRLNITLHNYFFKNCKTNCSGSNGIKNSTTAVIAIMEISAIVSKGKKERKKKKWLKCLSKHSAKHFFHELCRHILWISLFNIHSNSRGREYFTPSYKLKNVGSKD